MTLGTYGEITLQQARETARRRKAEIAEGIDPLTNKRALRAAPTMTDLAIRYMAEHALVKKKPKSAREDEKNIQNHVLPNLGRFKVHEVSRENISTIHHQLRETPYQANRVLALLSKMFTLAEVWSLRADGTNPCRHVEKFAEKGRERYLSLEELGRLNAVLSEAERARSMIPSAIHALRLLTLTGCRMSEILTLKWEYLDQENSRLHLPDSKTGSKTVRLSEPAMAVLSRIEPVEGNPYILVGRNQGSHLVNLEKPWQRIRAAAGLEDVRLHDLRHSFASIGIAQGMSLPEIGAMLGHSEPRTTARYAHLADAQIRATTEVIGAAIEKAMSGGEVRAEEYPAVAATVGSLEAQQMGVTAEEPQAVKAVSVPESEGESEWDGTDTYEPKKRSLEEMRKMRPELFGLTEKK
jgi:integrase